MGGRSQQSSLVPAALINVAFLAIFLFFLLFWCFLNFHFTLFSSICFSVLSLVSLETNVHEVFLVLHDICHRPLSSFLLFLTLLLNKIKCVLSFVSHVCFLFSGPLIFSLLPLTPLAIEPPTWSTNHHRAYQTVTFCFLSKQSLSQT